MPVDENVLNHCHIIASVISEQRKNTTDTIVDILCKYLYRKQL